MATAGTNVQRQGFGVGVGVGVARIHGEEPGQTVGVGEPGVMATS